MSFSGEPQRLLDVHEYSHISRIRKGASSHVEYWIPSASLSTFNAAMSRHDSSRIRLFRKSVRGFIPESFGLRGKDVVDQSVTLSKTWDYSRKDFVCEVAVAELEREGVI